MTAVRPYPAQKFGMVEIHSAGTLNHRLKDHRRNLFMMVTQHFIKLIC